MDVYLIPVGRGRYELYCEVVDEDAGDEGVLEPSKGFFKGLVHRFRETLKKAERDRRQSRAATPPKTGERRKWVRRMQQAVLRWVAEKVAEQRLLWHLRRQVQVTAIYPADLPAPEAMRIIQQMLKRDAERHRRWLIIDSILGLATIPLVFIPGPNVPFLYFSFRVVGHYLSIRGARHGLEKVEWSLKPSAPLTELRQAIALAPPQRERRVHDIAARLRLEHLATFFRRTALPSA